MKAMLVATALLASQTGHAQNAEGTRVSDPATLRQADPTSVKVIVPDCQGWQVNEPCAFVARPPKACVLDRPGAARVFTLLSEAVAAPRRSAPRPSVYATASIIVQFSRGRIAIAKVPLYPEIETGGDSHLWITYGKRRVWLSRARWNEIARLAQSEQCPQQPRQWFGEQ